MKRLRKVFKCDRSVYQQAKQRAEDEGIHFSRYIEKAVLSGIQDRSADKRQKEKHPLMFYCDNDLYAKAKRQAKNEGVYLSEWLEKILTDYSVC